MTAGATNIGIQHVMIFSFRRWAASAQCPSVASPAPVNVFHDAFHPTSRRHQVCATAVHIGQ